MAARHLDQASIALAGSLLYKNWQRPGAIVNATLREFEEAKVVREREKSLNVMSVEHRKTAMEGFEIVLEPVDHARVTQYIGTICRLQDVKNESQNLFLLTGGRPIQLRSRT